MVTSLSVNTNSIPDSTLLPHDNPSWENYRYYVAALYYYYNQSTTVTIGSGIRFTFDGVSYTDVALESGKAYRVFIRLYSGADKPVRKREEGREGGREREREGGREEGREGEREREKERERKGGREGERERERGREREREGGREGGGRGERAREKERGREGESKREREEGGRELSLKENKQCICTLHWIIGGWRWREIKLKE